MAIGAAVAVSVLDFITIKEFRIRLWKPPIRIANADRPETSAFGVVFSAIGTILLCLGTRDLLECRRRPPA